MRRCFMSRQWNHDWRSGEVMEPPDKYELVATYLTDSGGANVILHRIGSATDTICVPVEVLMEEWVKA